ncbi:hypothetical protein MSC49_40150 (plasmid) [Methylosinus sp. C49]|uniref:ribonucleotide reductase N-terminal alpha domain-containing protein n=1 Tax=Methylosinus sp. C49 TaxID=2699395 RepID=UPI0013670FD3|nr:ribonucleotide reductase N-terminal alpha domain-containing protein [Methylosinus sp. C49]BBU64080.1 hypothetical protein MSC49_40150 [Methylosinus sp. C49]
MNMISATPSRSIGATLPAISQQIWDEKYRLKAPTGEPIDLTVEDSWRRVARALAMAESDSAQWEETFYSALEDFKFLPGGRILAGAGVSRRVTLFNCFVMGTIEDDLDAIFSHLREAALTMQHGGGIGYDFSTLRPKGALVKGVGADASGPLSFMDVWNSMCGTIMSAGTRRGAMMATMRCDHPDIEAFVAAKADKTRLRNFNLSVLVTDAFMAAVDADRDWPLVFGGEVYRTIWARDLWDQIMRANYNYADPGVIFIDRINARNNLYYCETIAATNPCGEQPLPPYGACLLGSINLAKLVRDPFTERAHLDEDSLARLAAVAVRMLDNTIDVSEFALPEQREEALAKRRIGLGVTGVADALAMCRLTYGTPEAAAMAAAWVVALTRMISAVFRRGGDVAFVAEELKAVFDPRGGHWSEGRYVPSLVAAFGSIIERHMIDIGFLAPSEAIVAHASAEHLLARTLGPLCPKCSQPGLIKKDGCLTCRHCGWSKCS